MSIFKSVAVAAAEEAGEEILRLANEPIKFTMKNTRDIQAEADLRSERIIIDRLKEAFPDHSIFAEESGEETRGSEYLWVVDPLDGTINYARGVEEYCVSIALVHKGRAILGVIYRPVGKSLFVAEAGKGAYLNGKRIEVSQETELVSCLAATDNTSNPEARRKNFAVLLKVADEVRHVRIFGSAALHLIRIATGQLDLYFKTRLNYWDFAACTLILEEAGGVVTDMEGNPFTRDSKSIVAASKAVHSKALALIKNASEVK
jgi:myo-inositol-1(or 4)-monophosphatase